MAHHKLPHICFVPFPSPGRLIPMIDLANLFSSRGAHSTIFITRGNISRFASLVCHAATSGRRICFRLIPFPADAGIPDNLQCADSVTSSRFAAAVDLLAPLISRLLAEDTPDAIISDAYLPWTADLAAEHRIPRYSFTGTGCFALAVERALLLNRPQDRAGSDSEPFLVPGLPDLVYLTRSKLAERTQPETQRKELTKKGLESDTSTVGWVVNSFPELEPGYAEYYERETGKPVYTVGPVSLCIERREDAVERGWGPEAAQEATRVLSWLDGREPGTVVYVCFGSLYHFPAAQVRDIGMGLVDSGVPFVWVVRDDVEVEAAVEEKGLVVRGWAPQLVVLEHAAVGGFLTHCGWETITEATAAGVPTLTWPLFGDQFYNERLVAAVVGTGATVGADKGSVWGEEVASNGLLVGREEVAERVRWLMKGNGRGNDVELIRRKAKEMKEKARKAMAEGGSSYKNIALIMEDIWRHKLENS
ncbi:scopoletin glucosyltransferase-like [Typha latifolia]|uniref:scopoletin glucosyltransferase-like n=1 Tax=Typha latifolia TaxID=4733 RepID=UPI003C2EE20D